MFTYFIGVLNEQMFSRPNRSADPSGCRWGTACRLYPGAAKPAGPRHPELDRHQRWLEIYAGDKVARRFLKVDKISTALGTSDNAPRHYRYGYGVLDANLNMQVDPGGKEGVFRDQ